MFASGYTTLIVGIFLSLDIRGRMEDRLRRLVNRGTIRVTDGTDALFGKLEAIAAAWSRGIAVILAIVVLAAFLQAYRPDFSLGDIIETFAGTVAAYPAGRILGRMVAYGS